MSLRTIGPTSGKWSKIENGKRWEAGYRIDQRQSDEFVPVIHWRREGQAEQQTIVSSWPTRDSAAWAAERILAQLGYRPEVK